MKPVELRMKAFGSYVKEEIHFADFSHGLFLITGETGAGKTMIFDAISFALFGTTSGNDRADHLRDLHCDRSELSEDTCVTLVFEQNGKQYTVERSIHFWKKRDTGELKSSMDAVLTEPDGTTIRGAKDTSERIKDLLHINAEQFRKIVMLAQGEFREFLKADSEEKNEILGRLFDNSAFKRYQEMLSGAKELLEKERDENRRQLEALLKDGFADGEMTDGQQMLFHPEHPELLKNLEGLVSADKEQLAELEKEQNRIQDELGMLHKKHGAAERENADLDELKKNETHLRELQDRAAEIRQLQENVATTGRVLHSVKPAVDGWRNAKTNLESAGKDIEKQQHICDELNRAWTAAKAATEGDREAAEEAEKLGNSIQSLKDQEGSYQTLKKQAEARAAAEKAEKKAAGERAEAERNRGLLQEEQKKIEANLAELQDVDTAVATLTEARDAANSNLHLLTGADGIRDRIRTIREDTEDLHREEEKLKTLTEAAARKADRHNDLYRRFIAGRAGLLADDLRAEIESGGSAACPVCGTVHRKGDEAHFAVREEDTPSEADVDAAKQEAELAEKRRKEKDDSVQKSRDALKDGIRNILVQAHPLFPGRSWEEISEDAFLDAAGEEMRDRVHKSGEELKAAEERQQTRNGLQRKQEGNRQAIESAEGRIAELQKTESEQHAAFTEADGAMAVLKKTLMFESAEDAARQMREWTARRENLQKIIRKHTEDEREAGEAYSKKTGSLEEQKRAYPKLEEALCEAENNMRRTLQENGFDDPEKALACLDPMGGRSGEEWLEEQKRMLAQYTNDVENTEGRIRELKQKTADKTYTDLAELEGKIGAKTEEQNGINREMITVNNRKDHHAGILEKAEGYIKALDSSNVAWKRLSKLASLAVGTTDAGGKLSFDRYVMGTVYREILEMANRRLDIMSGGKYELMHKVEASHRSAKAGLETEVLDTTIGKTRPSPMLSGGEGFYASLALALGLSDVVQNRAGGMNLDALFIDEGFGTLSPDVLDKALEVLNQLTEGNRLVGIISHVDKLDESIPQKIRVFKDDQGSHAVPVFS